MSAADYAYFDAPVLALAHRGGALHPANVGRENSRHAFAEATALGYRYLETDVHATADGVLIAFHDEVLDRVTDRTGAVVDLTWAEIRPARIGGHDPIPTLDELLEAFPQARFNIDAKSAAAVDRLAEVIAAHQAYERVCVSSFGIGRLHRLRHRLGPRVASAASSLGVAGLRFAPWLARVLRSPAAALQIPVQARVLGREVTLVTPELIATAHRYGKQVHVWVVDDVPEMERLLDLGVDGIFTDRIVELKRVLQDRDLWSPDP